MNRLFICYLFVMSLSQLHVRVCNYDITFNLQLILPVIREYLNSCYVADYTIID